MLPALIRKFHDAKAQGQSEVVVWGTGSPRREFLHVDDLADACLFLMRHYDDAEHINVGTGRGPDDPRAGRDGARRSSTRRPQLVFDASKPDGTPRKLLDVTRLHALGWRHRIELREGIESSYAWFLANHDHARGAEKRARRPERAPPRAGLPRRRSDRWRSS